MDFNKAKIISTYLSRDYAGKIFELLVKYQDVSASEIASRLNMHIRPVQEFLETMATFEIIEKQEVYEKKRPYYRYSLKKNKIEVVIDLDKVFKNDGDQKAEFRIREVSNNIAKFSVARNGEYFSSLTIWESQKRDSKEHRISLTVPQGKFLYYLPFPDADPMSIDELITKSGVDVANKPEIIDIVELLHDNNIIEKIP